MRPAATALILALGVLAASWAGAQTPVTAPVVDDIRAEREGRPVTSPAILSLIETATGQPLSMRQVRETIAHLVNLNLFDDVQAWCDATTGTHAERLAKLGDPARRPALREKLPITATVSLSRSPPLTTPVSSAIRISRITWIIRSMSPAMNRDPSPATCSSSSSPSGVAIVMRSSSSMT